MIAGRSVNYVDDDGHLIKNTFDEPFLPPDFNETAIYEEGQKACREGEAAISNPWPLNTYAAAVWHDGWFSVD